MRVSIHILTSRPTYRGSEKNEDHSEKGFCCRFPLLSTLFWVLGGQRVFCVKTRITASNYGWGRGCWPIDVRAMQRTFPPGNRSRNDTVTRRNGSHAYKMKHRLSAEIVTLLFKKVDVISKSVIQQRSRSTALQGSTNTHSFVNRRAFSFLM